MNDMKNETISGLFSRSVSKKECTDTGMAMVLISLIVCLVTGVEYWVEISIVLLVLNMTWAKLYTYPAKFWLGLSGVLGSIMSKVLLTLIFFVVQTPMALLRRSLGHDPMMRKQWKNGTASVFVQRDHAFTVEEMERPY